jgi:hypothetical protein
MTTKALLLPVLALALVAVPGCSERRMRDRWRQVTGESRDVSRRVDLNTASERELARLPGLTDDDAERIIGNRPYGDKRGLLRKNVIGAGKYDQIEDYVYVSERRRRDDRY